MLRGETPHVPPAPSDIRRRSRSSRKRGGASDIAPEAVLSIAILTLVCIGVVMVYSASSASALLEDANPSGMLIRQGLFAIVALVAFAVCARVNPATLMKLAKPAVFIALGLLVVVLIPGFGIEANGARSWIGLGPVQMQPSEVAKLALIVWLAGYLARNVDRLDTWDGLKRPVGIMLVMGVLLMLEPDLGTSIVLLSTAFVMLVLSGVSARILGLMAVIAGVLTAALIAVAPYRTARLTSFLDPWSDPEGGGFQVVQAQLALGSGGVSGVGLGNGLQKVNYLPEAHTDFLLAVIGEEFGFVGIVVVIGTFLWLTRHIMLIGRQAVQMDQLFAGLVAQGVGIWIGFQAFINMGVNLGALPTKGLTLPLMSYGGSALLFNLIALAVVMRIDYENRQRGRGGRA